MAELPPESEKLLAIAPSEFVEQRKRLVGELRDAGRKDEAAALAAMRKPSAVVLAVNRAARNRPKAAGAAAEAAARLEKAQGKGDLDAFRGAVADLDESLDMLREVAITHVGQRPTEAMRRRVTDLLRRAVASDATREALLRGALLEEQEVAGFEAYAGMTVSARPRRGKRGAAADSRARRKTEERREREEALRAELATAEAELEEAKRSAREAERRHASAERAVASLRAKLDRLK